MLIELSLQLISLIKTLIIKIIVLEIQPSPNSVLIKNDTIGELTTSKTK